MANLKSSKVFLAPFADRINSAVNNIHGEPRKEVLVILEELQSVAGIKAAMITMRECLQADMRVDQHNAIVAKYKEFEAELERMGYVED